jgi:SAM-dependent methyltransferase
LSRPAIAMAIKSDSSVRVRPARESMDRTGSLDTPALGTYPAQEADQARSAMRATERLNSERTFHDRQARRRAAELAQQADGLRFGDAAYLDHETWIRPALGQLGDLRAARVLDYGCGHGMAAVVLARRGACVTAFDLSPGYLAEACARARANGVAVNFVQAEGERLPFADGAFDCVWGNAVLHHLDLRAAGRELFRILRPEGVAVFCEPWGENPLLNWARRRWPYPGKERTPDEQPLRWKHVRQLRQVFPAVELRGFQLLSMARRVLRFRRLVATLSWCDAMLLARVPTLERFCRYAVLTLRR